MPPLWRAFPWDPEAGEGEPFSKTFVSPTQGSGRFDLPGRPAGVLYLAEAPDHAIGELIQSVRGQALDDADLDRWGKRLALVRVEISDQAFVQIADLCDPKLLARYGIRPDALASRNRETTQRIAQDLLDLGHAGLRWWSSLGGDWHGTTLFREQVGVDQLLFGNPERIDIDHQAVREAASVLDIEIA